MEKEEKINELLTRGVEKVYPNQEFLQSKLNSGEKLTFFLGIDPTGPTLHLGHVIPLLKLRQFQNLGHNIILLIGDFTGMIGDPTDKGATRKRLTRAEVLENSKLYKKQASKIISFSGNNPAKLKYNSKWLGKLSFEDSFDILAHLTYAQAIKRDMFQKRIEEGKDLYLHELLYPMMQGYDSVAMDVDGEVGGNDQTFNMLMGRDLLKKMKSKEKFVISMKLLVDLEGKKMGKTEGNMVSLSESPEEMFGKIMSWSDGLILPAFELCTVVPMSEISEIKASLEGGENPKNAKEKLAETIVTFFHGSKKAIETQGAFQATFSQKKMPTEIPEFKATAGMFLVDCLIASKLISSKSEWRRLVGEGAISIVAEEGGSEKISDPNLKIVENSVWKIGKHRFLKIIV
ncbi:MAG: tyrosine--tRNA ligase [Candidatus Taylorbacteria bacterium]|nr:tyrosine--tRNA ligase [Candidatus Taylorbacteria bacterium]